MKVVKISLIEVSFICLSGVLSIRDMVLIVKPLLSLSRQIYSLSSMADHWLDNLRELICFEFLP